MAFRRKRTFKKRAPKRRFAKKTRGKRPALKKMIRREIARNVENKSAQIYVYDNRLYTVGNASFPINNIITVGIDPGGLSVPQGTGQGQRIGNTIKTKKLMFKGTIVPSAYDATFNAAPQPLQIKMWIFYDKTNPDDMPNPQAAGDFFQNGNTSKGFQNDLVDMWSPVNTDRYRVLTTRTFKLGQASHNSPASGSNGAISYSANNDFKYNCNFSLNLTKYYPQRVKFNDGSSVPSTRGLFCMWSYANAQGNAANVNNYSANVSYMLDYQYEDA